MPTRNTSAIASPTAVGTVARALQCVAPARADERWREGPIARRWSAFAIAVVAASLVLHAALLTIALFGTQAEAAPPQEIPVEVVQDVPPPAPPPPAAKPQQPEAPPPPEPVAAKPPPPPPSLAETQRAELQRQLDELKAEQQALKSETADLGPLRDSIRAAALPSHGGDGGDVVGYQSLVFSQLAKAKEGARETAKPGTVGVRFSVNEAGALTEVAVAVSSGVAELDTESLAIVRRAAPFPRPPAGAERTFSANFSYAVAQR